MMCSKQLFRALPIGLILLGVNAMAANKYADNYRFTAKEPWEFPEATLPPGDYILSVHDKLLDREIFQVKGAKDGKVYTNFLAIPGKGGDPKSVLTFWSGTGDSKAVRSWFVTSDAQSWDFVYPKARAIELAKLSSTPVPAVDLSAVQRPTNVLLSADDLHSVQLWLLTPKRVSPGDAGVEIAAAKIGPKRIRRATPATGEAPKMPRTASNFLGSLVAGFGLLGTSLFVLRRGLRREQ